MRAGSAGIVGWTERRTRVSEAAAVPAGNGAKPLLRALLAVTAIVTLMAAVPEAPAGQSAQVRLTVSATVKRWHRAELVGGPLTVQITAADIQRGYVDLLEPMRLLVRSNARNAYRFEVLNQSALVRAMDLMVRSETYALGAGGGVVPLQGTTVSPARDDFEVRYRLYLADGVSPGTYAWLPTVRLTVL